MKKTNFLKGLAAVVLGCMFTSCEKEDLNATFQPGKAVMNLTVEVFDGLTGEPVTESATINVNGGSFVQTEPGEYLWDSTTDIAATSVTITASLGKASASEVTINVDELKRGGNASYNATLLIAAGLEFTGVEVEPAETKDFYATFDNLSHDATHTHDGWTGWYMNKSDYFQPWTVTYTVNNVVVKAENFVEGEIYNSLTDANKTNIKNVYNAWEKIDLGTAEEVTLSGKASAWSYFNVKVTRKTTTTNWTVTDNATNKVAATYDVKAITCTTAVPVEFAAPGHAGHYHYGHGHGHGNNSNAGGGISIAE